MAFPFKYTKEGLRNSLILLKPRITYPTGTEQGEPVVSHSHSRRLLDAFEWQSQLALHMRSRPIRSRLHLSAPHRLVRPNLPPLVRPSDLFCSICSFRSKQPGLSGTCYTRWPRVRAIFCTYNCNSYVLYVRASIDDRSVCGLFPCCIVVFCWDTCIVRMYHGPYFFTVLYISCS
jgi:hypothetical protein